METEWSGLKTLEKIILNGGSISRFIDWAACFFEKKKIVFRGSKNWFFKVTCFNYGVVSKESLKGIQGLNCFSWLVNLCKKFMSEKFVTCNESIMELQVSLILS